MRLSISLALFFCPLVLNTSDISSTSSCKRIFREFNVDFETKSKKGWYRVITNGQLVKYGCDSPSEQQKQKLLECIDSMPDDFGRVIGAKK